MKVTTREIGNREVELTIEVDEGRIDRAMRGVARRYAREVRIPGFRPGKAPYALIAQRVGTDRLFQAALEEIGPQIYEDALKEAGIQAYDLRPLEIAGYDPLTLTTTIPLMPMAELGDYHLIHIDPPTVEVTEKEIDEVLREYQAENAQLVPVDRGAELGDQVILDLKIEVAGAPVYQRENISFVLSPGGLTGVPEGFAEQIVGQVAGESREFALPYPDDFPDEEWAGKEGIFTILLHEVKERELPEIDDELAQIVGEFETLDELRARIRAVLLSRAEVQADNELVEAVLTRLMETSTVEYPDVALEDEIDRVIADLEDRLSSQGLTLDNYLVMEGLSRDQLREQQHAEAARRLKRSIILSEVVRREAIEVSDKEVDEEIASIVQMYGARAAEARASLSSAESRQSLRSRLLAQKAIERLVEIATRDQPDDTATPLVDTGDAAGDPSIAQSDDNDD